MVAHHYGRSLLASLGHPDLRIDAFHPSSPDLEWASSGAPWIWLTGGTISVCIILVVGLLLYIAAKGLGHFWPADVVDAVYREPGQADVRVVGEVVERASYTRARLVSAGLPIQDDKESYERYLVKVGNRDFLGADFRYLLSDWLVERRYPADLFDASAETEASLRKWYVPN